MCTISGPARRVFTGTKIAPSDRVANIAVRKSGLFSPTYATASPRPTPQARSRAAVRSDCSASSA